MKASLQTFDELKCDKAIRSGNWDKVRLIFLLRLPRVFFFSLLDFNQQLQITKIALTDTRRCLNLNRRDKEKILVVHMR